MATTVHDFRGLKCPVPAMRITQLAFKCDPGDIIEALADCPSFEQNVRDWATKNKKTILWFKQEGSAKRCQIRL